MKIMMLGKHAENRGPPPTELMDAIAILGEEAAKDGTMSGNGGLAPNRAEHTGPGLERPPFSN